MKKNLQLITKIVVSSVLLGIILWRVDKPMLVENIKLLDLRYVPFIFILIALNYIVGSFRWKALLIHKNSEHVTVPYLTSLYFIGAFFNNFMPTSVGGDVYKVYRLGKKNK
ncbi:lysylphosphatidylglycerol synthase transmembrane domain-containing protein [Patescibacteria group bacterium]